MRAIGVTVGRPATDPACFVEFETPAPEPGARDLRVRIEAVAVNPVDYKVRQGIKEPLPQPRIIGWDAAGVVEAVGPDVRHFRVGDEVMYAGAIDRPGCYAQAQLVDERIVGRKPINLDFADAAALPLTSLTAWESLFDRLRVAGAEQAGRALLVIGGAGGVGSIAIQLARRLTHLTVIATASRPDSRAWCLELGAHHVIDHRKDLAEGLRAAGLGPVAYILNTGDNAPYWSAMAEIVAPQGAICLLSSHGGTVDPALFMAKSVAICWELMYTRSSFRTGDMGRQREILNAIADMVERGEVRGTAKVRLGPLSAATAAEAHRLLESRTMIGKLVLTGMG
jgi:zinc-binding alcohol dehydrogenase family protein